MKKMICLSKNWYFSVQKALIYYTVNKSQHNSFILLVFSHVANFRYVANFRFLTLYGARHTKIYPDVYEQPLSPIQYVMDLRLAEGSSFFAVRQNFSSENEISVYIMYSYMYWLLH